MMPAGPVNVAVGDFGLGRRPPGEHFNFEEEILPGQRMIGVESHLAAFNRHDPDDGGMMVLARLELIADIDLLDREGIPFDRLDHPFITFAVGARGLDNDLLPHIQRGPDQRSLEPFDDGPGPGEKGDRRIGGG